MVERHRLDADLARDSPHRHGIEPFLVHDAQRGLDHTVTRETLPRDAVVACGLLGSSWLVRVLCGHLVVLRMFTRIGVDRLTVYAYPPYIVSIHRTSSVGREPTRRRGEHRDEAQSRIAREGEQPSPVEDRRSSGSSCSSPGIASAATLLGPALTTDFDFTNSPEAKRAQQLLEERNLTEDVITETFVRRG